MSGSRRADTTMAGFLRLQQGLAETVKELDGQLKMLKATGDQRVMAYELGIRFALDQINAVTARVSRKTPSWNDFVEVRQRLEHELKQSWEGR